MDSAIDDITKMYSSGTEKINVENINAGKSINSGNPGTGTTGTGSAGAATAEATEEVKPREFKSPMEKIIAETEYGPAGKTMETSGVFTEDAGKYNLKNIAEMEAKVGIEAKIANQLQLDNIPTSGAYEIGYFIENKTPTILGTTGSKYIINGWKRITNGSNHVLNTDWVELRFLTGA